MPTVIKLKDGKVTTLLSRWNFVELIEEHMGADAADYCESLCDLIDELEDENRDLLKENTKMEEKLDGY